MSLSVVMVSYRTGPILLEAIQAVLADDAIAELILVDNGNSAQDRARLWDTAVRDDRVRLLQGHGNIGFARACNYGAALATGDELLFLNPDAVLEVGAAQMMVAAGRDMPRPWIAGGQIVDDNGVEQRGSRRGELTVLSALLSFTPLHKLPGVKSFNWDSQPLPDGPIRVPTVSGAMLMTDRASFDRLGGFDAGYFLHVEDIALCRHAREVGGAVVFVPGARALHYGATSQASSWHVETHKLRGFLRYFGTKGDGSPASFGRRAATALVAPLLAVAILGRALLRR